MQTMQPAFSTTPCFVGYHCTVLFKEKERPIPFRGGIYDIEIADGDYSNKQYKGAISLYDRLVSFYVVNEMAGFI